MTQLYEIKVKLSDNQKGNLSRALDSLTGNDTLYVCKTVVTRLNKNRKMNKGMDIKLCKTNIRKQIGGSLLTSILTMGRA